MAKGKASRAPSPLEKKLASIRAKLLGNPSMKELQRLQFSLHFLPYFNLNDTGFATFRGLTQLKELRCAQCRIGAHGLDPFVGLESLDASYSTFSSNSAAGLANMRNLRRLYLRDTTLTDEGIRHVAVKVNLVIGPLKLPDHPHRAAHRQQHPEDITAPVRRSRVDQKTGVGEQRDETLHDVAEGGERRPGLQIQRDPGISAEKNGPGSHEPGNSAGIRRHNGS